MKIKSKIKRKPTAEDKGYIDHVKSQVSKVTPLKGGVVELYHSQEVKLSHSYQSASSVYGVKLIVEDNKLAIKKGIRRAERIVEAPLVMKVREQHKMLRELANASA
jgi:hypothetical protein